MVCDRHVVVRVAESCAAAAAAGSDVETDTLTVNVDDAGNYIPHDRHHRLDDDDDDNDADNDSWQPDGDAVSSGVTTADILLTVDSSTLMAENSSNGASTLSAGDTNGASTTSAGNCVSSDGSFNGFVIAMHRKMVLGHFLLFVPFIFT